MGPGPLVRRGVVDEEARRGILLPGEAERRVECRGVRLTGGAPGAAHGAYGKNIKNVCVKNSGVSLRQTYVCTHKTTQTYINKYT